MIIKEREYEACSECGLSKLVKEAVFGCDNCKKPINFNKPDKEREYLHVTVFYHDEACETDNLHFCSWGCVFEKLKETKTDSFISLPYLSFDVANPEIGVEGFWKALEKPGVTEEWREEKAKELITMVSNLYPYEGSPCVIPKSKAKDFIRSLVEEIQGK